MEEWQPPSLLLPPRGAPSEQPASIHQPRGGPLAWDRAEAEEAGLSVEECHWSPLGAGIPSRCSNSRWLPPPHGMALEAALEWAAAVVTAAAALLASSPWQPPSLRCRHAARLLSSRHPIAVTREAAAATVWWLRNFLLRRNFNPEGATRDSLEIKRGLWWASFQISRAY